MEFIIRIIYFSNKKKLICLPIVLIVTSLFFLFGYAILRNNRKEDIPVSSLEEKIIENNFENSKVAYLTFDDGPSTKETRKILEILKEENVKATFFVIGKQVKEHPEIVKLEFEEGHYIANHGYSHDNNKLYKDSENFESEIKNTDIEIGKAIGVDNYCSHVFRFPNGYMSKIYIKQKKWAVKKLEELDYFYVDWNCLNKDSEVKISNAQLIKNLKNTSKDKTPLIILMHDTGDVNNTSDVLKESIEYLKNEGYEFRNMYDFVSPTR